MAFGKPLGNLRIGAASRETSRVIRRLELSVHPQISRGGDRSGKLSPFTNSPWFNPLQDGRVKGHVLIFSCENTKLTTSCWTTINMKMLEPTKKDTPHPRTKEQPHQDGRRGPIVFKIKPHTRQRCCRAQTKACVLQDPGERSSNPTRDWATLAYECFELSGEGLGWRWLALWPGALTAAALGDAVCWQKVFWRRLPLPLP